jgi:2-succinyl-6-hydroxy-2,4-cyclohexadiene-1-carboxylate synthase
MFVRINDVQYYVNIEGEGPPLLLLHGFTGSTETWEPFVKDWKKTFKLIRVDILGHGASDSPVDPDRYSIERVSQDFISLLDELGIEQTSILGYSMGGRLAITMAVLHPERVSSLFLESSSPGLEAIEERVNRMEKDEALANQIEQEEMTSFVDYWEKIPLFAGQRTLPEELRIHIRNERLKNSTIGLANSLRGMGTGKQPSFWTRLQTIKIPVLLMAGSDDQKFCTIAEKMHKSMPNSEIKIFFGAGHAIHVEQPQIFGKIVTKTIDNWKD